MTIRELLFAILGILASALVIAIIYLFAEEKRLNKELTDARFWIGWHKGWAAGWESCKEPKEVDPHSCAECKHALCPMNSEPCATCISTLKVKHVTRSKFEPFEPVEGNKP